VTDDEERDIYQTAQTVAVVGISDNPERPSLAVASFLQQRGYRIVPVNPALSEALGERSFANLRDVDVPIDVVDIFRRSDAVPPIVEDAIAIGAKVVWMQEGVVSEEAAERARAAGVRVIMDRCMKKEYRRLFE
jgi:predicted CoA-binding protein